MLAVRPGESIPTRFIKTGLSLSLLMTKSESFCQFLSFGLMPEYPQRRSDDLILEQNLEAVSRK